MKSDGLNIPLSISGDRPSANNILEKFSMGSSSWEEPGEALMGEPRLVTVLSRASSIGGMLAGSSPNMSGALPTTKSRAITFFAYLIILSP